MLCSLLNLPTKLLQVYRAGSTPFRPCKRSLLSVSNTQTPFVDLPFSLFAYIKFHRIFFPLTQLIEFYKGKSNLMNMNYSLLMNFFVRCYYIVDTVKLTFTLEVIPQARKHGIKLGILNEIYGLIRTYLVPYNLFMIHSSVHQKGIIFNEIKVFVSKRDLRTKLLRTRTEYVVMHNCRPLKD